VGRGWGWGSQDEQRRASSHHPPSPALPHKGGGSRPSSPRSLS
jgi:hypothetical protein